MKRVAVITSSDKGYRGEREDLSGPTVKEIMEKNGYQVVSLEILPDEREMLSKRMAQIADENLAELILTTGGTGFSKRDVMPEATEDVIQSARNPGSYAGLQFDYYEEGYVKQGNCRNPGRHFDHKSSRKP